MQNQAAKARNLYADLISTLAAAGEVEKARACAHLAVEQGVWAHPDQRPLQYIASLPAQPIYAAHKFWVASYLEQHAAAIQQELDAVLASEVQGFTPVEERLLSTGRWDEVIFYEGGHRFERSHQLFPATSKLLEAIPEEIRSAGVIMLSWLHPRSHIMPHCGHTNARLRVHLGLQVPDQVSIRVHDQVLTWTEGKCLVFDDSFEHEVWHSGDRPRIILLFDIFHPALEEEEKQALLSEAQHSVQQKAVEFMKNRGLGRISLDPAEKLQVEVDESTRLYLSRYLRESGIERVELVGEELKVQYA